MVYEITIVKVQEYDKWKMGLFDELASILKEKGAKCRRLFRDLEDPDKVIIIIDWKNLKNAKKLADDKELRVKFQKVEVINLIYAILMK